MRSEVVSLIWLIGPPALICGMCVYATSNNGFDEKMEASDLEIKQLKRENERELREQKRILDLHRDVSRLNGQVEELKELIVLQCEKSKE